MKKYITAVIFLLIVTAGITAGIRYFLFSSGDAGAGFFKTFPARILPTTPGVDCSELLVNNDQLNHGHPESVTLNFVHWSSFPKKIFSAFSEKYPHIEVEFEQFGRQQYPEIQRARISSGENIDLMGIMENDYGLLAGNEYLVDLSRKDLMKNYRQEATEALAARSPGGRLYAVPYNSWVLGVWYNKILFNKYYVKVPEDYNEFLETCRVLKSNGVSPMVLGCKDEGVSSFIFFTRIWNSAGSDANFFRKVSSGEIQWTDATIHKSLSEVDKFVKNGYLLKDSINLTYQQAFYEFIRGRAAMCLMSDLSLDMIEPGVEKVCDLGVFPIPYNDAGQPTMTPGTRAGLLMGIYSGSQNKKETELLLEFLSQTEVAQVYSELTRSNSNVKGVSAKELKYNELWEPLRNKDYIVTPSEVLSHELLAKLNKSAREFLIGIKTPEQLQQELMYSQYESSFKKIN